jgi:hypothetical protein
MQTLQTDDSRITYGNENDHLVAVFLNGERFTGILKDEWEQTEYQNGMANGESLCFFETGEIRENNFYKNGELLTTKRFYENGSLMSYLTTKPYSYKVWNINSILVRENNIFYYNNGEIKKIFGNNQIDDFSVKAFAKNGQIIYTVVKDIWIDNKIVRNVVYNDNELHNCYFDALIEENPELADTEEKNDTHHIWMWFWKVFESNFDKYFEIVDRLMTHPEIEVQKTIANIIALHKFHNYISNQNSENSSCYEIIKECSKYHDEREPNREIKQPNK